MISLDSTTLTNPTGTPITSSGLILPSFTSSSKRTKAVGALPTAIITGPSTSQAFSIQAAARVEPASLALSATSASAIKQTALPPSLFKPGLFIPTQAILVSVTIVAPFFSASKAFSTTPFEKCRVRA